jgi:hypothetical protein
MKEVSVENRWGNFYAGNHLSELDPGDGRYFQTIDLFYSQYQKTKSWGKIAARFFTPFTLNPHGKLTIKGPASDAWGVRLVDVEEPVFFSVEGARKKG